MTLNVLEQITAILLGLALLLGFLRLLIGPTAQDRVVSADTLSVIVTAGLVGVAAWLGNSIYLDVALVYGALAFVGIVAIARAIEGGHQ
jgi:multisubunit Na+/H+ antiporter MnhF subunit